MRQVPSVEVGFFECHRHAWCWEVGCGMPNKNWWWQWCVNVFIPFSVGVFGRGWDKGLLAGFVALAGFAVQAVWTTVHDSSRGRSLKQLCLVHIISAGQYCQPPPFLPSYPFALTSSAAIGLQMNSGFFACSLALWLV